MRSWDMNASSLGWNVAKAVSGTKSILVLPHLQLPEIFRKKLLQRDSQCRHKSDENRAAKASHARSPPCVGGFLLIILSGLSFGLQRLNHQDDLFQFRESQGDQSKLQQQRSEGNKDSFLHRCNLLHLPHSKDNLQGL